MNKGNNPNKHFLGRITYLFINNIIFNLLIMIMSNVLILKIEITPIYTACKRIYKINNDRGLIDPHHMKLSFKKKQTVKVPNFFKILYI